MLFYSFICLYEYFLYCLVCFSWYLFDMVRYLYIPSLCYCSMIIFVILSFIFANVLCLCAFLCFFIACDVALYLYIPSLCFCTIANLCVLVFIFYLICLVYIISHFVLLYWMFVCFYCDSDILVIIVYDILVFLSVIVASVLCRYAFRGYFENLFFAFLSFLLCA